MAAMLPRLPFLAVTTMLILGGCKDREIASYRAPKDPVPAMPGAPAGATNTNDLPAGHPPIGTANPGGDSMANSAVPTAEGSDLTWTAPAQWTTMPARAMRKATYAVKGDNGATADLSITAFPGSTGGLLANLNRWRGQVGLPPLVEADLPTSLEHLEVGNLHLDVVDFPGTANGAPTRILGALVPHGSDTWFFKLTGPDALVAHEKPFFLDFLRTIKEAR
jgi:hypothetical protein